MSVATILKRIIVDALGVDEDAVTLDSSFTDDLGADSLELVEIVMAVEEEFGIDIPDADAEQLDTIHELFEYVVKAASGEQPAAAPAGETAPVVDSGTPAPDPPFAEPPVPGDAQPAAADDGEDEDDATAYTVLVNAEEKYAIWPFDREVPAGWREAGMRGTKRECLDYIAEVGDDAQPHSLRPKMPGG